MINSPVLKLQDMASSSSTDIEELLSRARMMSVKLGLQDISEWLEYELNGYPSIDLLPDYRILKGLPIRAFNPYVGWIPFQLGNVNGEYREIYESLTTIHLNNSASMLVEYAKSDNTLYSDLPAYMADFLQKAVNCDFRIAWSINPTQITKILSNIRSRILDWALRLESKNILGEGLLFSQEEKKEAVGMTVNNINNFNANVNNAGSIGAGNIGDINQQNTTITGDFNSLAQQLKEYGIDDKDIAELKLAVEESPKPTSSGNLGGRIGGWVGNMIGKAYSGTLKIAGSAAPALLTNAICHYYNIPV
ncbi:TPA: abortive phage resistance protein [Yersinia enterocolitica]|uniref:AbiTii domain-containing protein n=1 Tax=Yersinia massiliensis TaxID=419257 RepID=UPI0028D90C4A|nr:abortive phage resistance protein [Yersinia massiliensis]